MLPAAVVAHSARGRTRFKIAARRRDAVYFAVVERRLCAAPDVDCVEVNPLTASVLVIHRGSVQALSQYAEVNELFQSGTLAERLPEALRQQGSALDRQIRDLTGQFLDLESVALLVLLGVGLTQLLRGQIVAPALTVFWYAATLLAASNKHSRNGST